MKRYSKYVQKYKVVLLVFLILFAMAIGGGIRTALADQDIALMMSNWFNKKKEASVADIEQAITKEKQILLNDLEVSLSSEMQKAADQLISFANLEKQNRIVSLNEYAESLKSQMKIDNSEQEKVIRNNLDAIIAHAKAQMDGQANELTLLPIPPVTEEKEKEAPNVPLENEEEQGKGEQEERPNNTDQEGEKKTTPIDDKDNTVDPIVGADKPKVVDIYSITDWFNPPNIQGILVEEIEIPNGVFSINNSFSDILMNPQAADAMRSILRGIEKHPQFAEIQYKSIDEMSRICPALFNETILYMLNKSLVQIKI